MIISIIVTVYNLEKYINRTLESVFTQTYQNIEVIAVDDGSTDKTPALLDAYAEKENRLKVIHKINEGVSKARLTGIKAAKGEYIGFVDGDDMVDHDMYERLLNNALKHGADISHCGYRMIKPDGTVDYYYNTGDIILQNNEQGIFDLLNGSRIEPSLCNKLFRKSLLKNLQTDFSIKNNEDLLMNYFLFKESDKSVYEDFCPYRYIVRENSASKQSLNSSILSDPVKAANIIFNDIKDNKRLKSAAARLYGIKLVSAATYNGKKNAEINSVVKSARKELKSFLSVYRLNISKRSDLIRTSVAAYFPKFYSLIHILYLKLK
jgi:glycosyltransferase involved in cell wall biosynthesis